MSPAAAEALDNISSLRILDPLDPSKVIRQAANFSQLAAKTKRLDAILDRVPTAIDMESLASTNSKILKATRLESSRGGRGRQETTSVKILWEGATLPKYLSIGILGRFPTCRYVPDPRQCYRCLWFGHIVRVCVAESPRCDHCTGPHESRVCWGKRRAKETMPEHRCTNYEGKHAASSTWCPKCRSIVSTLSATTQAPVRNDPGPASAVTPSTEEDREGLSVDASKYPRSKPGPLGWFRDRHQAPGGEGWW